MNTKLIEQTEVVNLPYFPILEAHKSNRVITKHFTNLPLYLNPNNFALLTWLIYQSKADNSVKYSTKLLQKYSSAVMEANKEYCKNKSVLLLTSLPSARLTFQTLIQKGYLLPSHLKGYFVINPLLSYREEYIKPSEYRELCKDYQVICNLLVVAGDKKHKLITGFTKQLFDTVGSKMVAKKLTTKPKYEYGSNR